MLQNESFVNLEQISVGNEANLDKVRERFKRKVFARDQIFGGRCVPKLLPLKDSHTTR